MTSVSEPPSQPESLDLDYDMWQGQFEFVGNNNNNNNIKLNDNNKNSSQNHNNNNNNKNYDSLEDLNFMTTSQDFSKHPILIDDETFLSLNPNDFDDTNNNSNNNSLISGPNSTIFIDNKLNDNNNINNNDLITTATLTTVPTVIQFDLNEKNCLLNNKENSLNNKLISKQLNNLNNNNCYKIENIKNYKNKLICGDFTDKLTNSHQIQQPLLLDTTMQQSGKLNGGITAEICDNLNEQLELLQRQVTDLTDSQSTVEDRTTRTKTEYAVLQARYHMLEEQYRESELRAEERLAEEQKRNRDLLARIEREAELQNENCQIKIRTIEIEANTLREEAQRLRILCDKQSNDLHATEEKLELARDSIMNLTQDLEEAQLKEKKLIDDKQIQEDLMIELSHELEKLRSEIGTPAMPTTSPETLRLEELHMEMDELRKKNKLLEEQNEELQAAVLTRGVEEGRHLLNGTLNSLAQELEEMSQTQDSVDSATLASLSQLQQAFQDKEDENLRLKTYIDTILLNIVENYPQLLEVKPPTMPNENSKIPKLKKKLSN